MTNLSLLQTLTDNVCRANGVDPDDILACLELAKHMNKNMDKPDIVSLFKQETKLQLRETIPGSKEYVECSGASYKKIKKCVSEFREKHQVNISCYDDSSKDATYIVF